VKYSLSVTKLPDLEEEGSHKMRINLQIFNVTEADYREHRCHVENRLGRADGGIRLYGEIWCRYTVGIRTYIVDLSLFDLVYSMFLCLFVELREHVIKAPSIVYTKKNGNTSQH